jgi:hypothetical protein
MPAVGTLIAEKAALRPYMSNCKPHIYETYFLTSGTASLSRCVFLSQSVQPLPWTECLVPMAFVCVQLRTKSFSSASLFNCGVPPSRIPALEGVYLA